MNVGQEENIHYCRKPIALRFQPTAAASYAHGLVPEGKANGAQGSVLYITTLLSIATSSLAPSGVNARLGTPGHRSLKSNSPTLFVAVLSLIRARSRVGTPHWTLIRSTSAGLLSDTRSREV